ncbi:MAG: hypothetical protein VST67_08405 [Nitrospirota bacterium]|nr:hypothetical protein [Nitrospirota bacterium]
MGHTIGIVTMLMLFLSPILYPVSALPEPYRPFLHMNPSPLSSNNPGKVQSSRLVADWQLECCPTREGTRAEGGCKPRHVPMVGCHKQGSLNYRARATLHEPGYHRVYGETTKRAPEASVFTAHHSMTEWRGEVGVPRRQRRSL